ncbi:hypothetical protein TrLO_g3581 [Triparma laevis f. longispina]|uniref:Transcription factor CBF/NF-Y/archaeal histone domain-containing protein n=1 Tax=Triparma laevis f. longispina TaxID=1714387 RepID=A0A9W6ZHL7_9STRA|nr:hypothetical protein TrLO_g3581 [Triparma laevis f. longispina]
MEDDSAPPPAAPLTSAPVPAPVATPAPAPAPVSAPVAAPAPLAAADPLQPTTLPPAPSSPAKPPSNSNPNPLKRSHDQGHDFEPPAHSIRKILKSSLPPHATVSKEASAAFTRAAGIFILYLSSCANDLARDHSRTTVSSQDVLDAVKELELGPLFSSKMQEFLKAFQEDENNKKIEKEKQKQAQLEAEAAKQAAVEPTSTTTTTTGMESETIAFSNNVE